MLLKSYTRCLVLLSLTAMLASSVHSQQTAALIGTAKFFRPDDPQRPDLPQLGVQYSTVLVASDGATASVKATLPDIIVPHEKDWWRVGVKFDCQTMERPDTTQESPDTEAGDWVEQLYVSRIGEVPQVLPGFSPSTDACPAQLVADFKRGKDRRAPKDAADLVGAAPFQPCVYRTVTITAVTPNFVSTTDHGGNSGECETRGFSWTDGASTQRMEDSMPVPYSDVLGQQGWEEYNRVLVESGKALADSGFNCDLSEEALKQKEPQMAHDIGWYLGRAEGRWMAVASYQPGNASCQYAGALSLRLPKEVVGYDTLRPEWASLERQLRGLRDAFTSPAGDLLVAIRESQVEIYALRGQKVGDKLVALPADRVVMVQWAAGKYVDGWVKEMQTWEKKTLPPPMIRKQEDTN